MNKFLRSFIYVCIIFSFINSNLVFADENEYIVFNYNDNSNILFSSSSYEEAYSFYIYNVNDYDNLCIEYNNEVINMEYGTLFINSNDDKVTYYSEYKDIDVEISFFNEYDLLYLNEYDDKVRFMLEGDVGLIDKSLVDYYPYGSRRVSYYGISNNSLVHHVASSYDNYFKYNFKIDEALSYMSEGVSYFSYDNHFFYDDFYKMSDDYVNNTYENAINKDEPYYNYYAYLPFRSYTNYSLSDFNDFIFNTLGFNDSIYSYADFDGDLANDVLNKSLLYDNLKAFVSSEKIYGVNALSSLAWGMLESNYGKSLNAFINNNLYNHEALDFIESDNNKYRSITSSIYGHVRDFVSRYYCNIFTTYYMGGFMGDFGSGVGSIYSYNPLFSKMYVDKVYYIDRSLGLKDKNSYSLAIAKDQISMYYDEETKSLYKIYRNIINSSFIIIEDKDDHYKVVNDFSMNQSGEYNPLKCTMYIKKKSVDYVLEGLNDNFNYNTYKVDYRDYNGNIYTLYSKNDFDVINDFSFLEIDGYDITGFELNGDIYKPICKKIKDINILDLKYPCLKNGVYNIEKAKLNIIYDDDSNKTVHLKSENIIDIDSSNLSSNVTYIYNGIKKEINIKGNYPLVDNYKTSIDDLVSYFKNNYTSVNFDDVKDLDNVFKRSDTISTYINDNDYDFSFEGANPTFLYYESKILPKIINTYYFNIKKGTPSKRLNDTISNYGLTFVDAIDISLSRCFYHVDFVSPISMQVKVIDENANNIYSVYHLDRNGNYVKVPTEFSDNYVRFLAFEDGTFYIFKTSSASTYKLDDYHLAITSENNSPDYYSLAFDGLLYILISIIGYVIIALYYVLNRKEKRIWKDFKKQLQKVESVLEEKQNS